MPLPKPIADAIAGELATLKAAKAGGYFYLIVGKKVPWILAARSPSAAAEKYKAAKKLILASDRLAFLPGSAVFQGPILFKANRIVLVLDTASPNQDGEALEKWLQTAALRLAQEAPQETAKEIKQISVFMTRTLVVGATETERMAALDALGKETYAKTGVEVELPGFDEASVKDVERIKEPIGKQLKAVSTDEVIRSAAAHDQEVFDALAQTYRDAVAELVRLLGQTWATDPISTLLAHAPGTAKSRTCWVVDLLRDAMAVGTSVSRQLAGFELPDSDAPEALIVRITADLDAMRTVRSAVDAIIVRCETCSDPLDDDDDGVRPHTANLACKLWFHQACLDTMSQKKKEIALLKRAMSPGDPSTCPRCDEEVDPRTYEPYLGRKFTSDLYELSQRAPDEDASKTLAVFGTFPCPTCKTPYAWAGGCDIVRCPRAKCGAFNVFKGSSHSKGAKSHSSFMVKEMTTVLDFVADGTLQKVLKGDESGAEKAAQVEKFLLAKEISPTLIRAMRFNELFKELQDAAMAGAVNRIAPLLGDTCHSPMFEPMYDALTRYYTTKARKVASSGTCCCYLTTACTAARGLPDDCEELTTLRRFRDGWLMAQPGGPALVETYYDLAPRILAGIEGRADAGAALDAIYAVVRRCVDRIHAGDNEGALAEYQALSLSLAAEAGLIGDNVQT